MHDSERKVHIKYIACRTKQVSHKTTLATFLATLPTNSQYGPKNQPRRIGLGNFRVHNILGPLKNPHCPKRIREPFAYNEYTSVPRIIRPLDQFISLEESMKSWYIVRRFASGLQSLYLKTIPKHFVRRFAKFVVLLSYDRIDQIQRLVYLSLRASPLPQPPAHFSPSRVWALSSPFGKGSAAAERSRLVGKT